MLNPANCVACIEESPRIKSVHTAAACIYNLNLFVQATSSLFVYVVLVHLGTTETLNLNDRKYINDSM